MIQTTLRHWEYYGTTEIFSNLYAMSKDGNNFHKLYDIIISDENILLAYRSIKSNKGSSTAGTDKFSISNYKGLTRDDFISLIRDRLENYRPGRLREPIFQKRMVN